MQQFLVSEYSTSQTEVVLTTCMTIYVIVTKHYCLFDYINANCRSKNFWCYNY